MRPKIRPGARNFAQVIFPDYRRGSVPDCHNTETALGEKYAKSFEAVSKIIDKYKTLNGTSPPFFLEPERYKGTSER